MRAVVCNELGPPSLLRVEERPDPEPRPGQVVVDVEAAGEAQTYSYMCVVTQGSAFVQRTMN